MDLVSYARLLPTIASTLYGSEQPTAQDIEQGGATMAAMFADLPALLQVLGPQSGTYAIWDYESHYDTHPQQPAHTAEPVLLREYGNMRGGEYTLVMVVQTASGPGLVIAPNGCPLASALEFWVVPATH